MPEEGTRSHYRYLEDTMWLLGIELITLKEYLVFLTFEPSLQPLPSLPFSKVLEVQVGLGLLIAGIQAYATIPGSPILDPGRVRHPSTPCSFPCLLALLSSKLSSRVW